MSGSTLVSTVAVTVACGVIVVWAVALIVTDIRSRRLPNVLVVPVAAGAVMAAILLNPWALVGLVWAVVYAVVPGIGGGDVKLATALGIATWWVSPYATIVAIGLAGALSVGAALLVRQHTVPHGPAMLVAAAASVALFMLTGWAG